MKRAIVVGSGAGGATAAKELQGAFHVTVIEAGKDFHPFTLNLRRLSRLKKTGLFFDAREIQILFPHMRIRKATGGMILVNGVGLGGTTTLCTANALRMDRELQNLGIDLDQEFEEIGREIPISSDHLRRWTRTTHRLFDICREMGMEPSPTPKMGNYDNCRGCGRCVLGCPRGVKWDSRRFLDEALGKGASLIKNSFVDRVDIVGGEAKGVWTRYRGKKRFIPADLVVLAAGGMGSPVILQNSGVSCRPGLFVDPVLCVAAEWKGSGQNREISMPFMVRKQDYMLSPYFDHLSFFFNRRWKFPAQDILSLMIKLADSSQGSVSEKKVDKRLSSQDAATLEEAVGVCREILMRLGIKEDDVFMGTTNAGHPGGVFPLTEKEAQTLHHSALPENLYVADASLLPKSLGGPPILTIVALAKRVGRVCIERMAG